MKNYVKSTSLPCITLASVLLSYTATAAEIIEIKKTFKGENALVKEVTQNANGVFAEASNLSVNGVNTTLRSNSQSLSRGQASAPIMLDGNLDIPVTITEADTQSSMPNTQKSFSNSTAYSYTLKEDFNGDGCTDTATVSDKSINIYHPCKGTTNYYNFSDYIAINGVYDTDGESGKEIGVVNAPYFEIIDDKEGRRRSYRLGNDWAINGNYDADGNDGDEIGIVMPNNLLFIVDKSAKTTSNFLSWRSWSINGNYDTDGDPGVELGIVTDGYFSLYDLRDYRWRHYGIPGSYFINGAQNIDGKAGKEVLINNYDYQRNATIYDADYKITWENY